MIVFCRKEGRSGISSNSLLCSSESGHEISASMINEDSMRLKPVISICLLLLIAFPTAGLAKERWISISPMAFSTHDESGKALIYKTEFGDEAYVTLGTTYGHVWAPVNFPPDADKCEVRLVEARVFDNLDILNGTQTMDYAALAVGLVRIDFESGQTENVIWFGTAWQGAPGHIILSGSPPGKTEIDNQKYSWYLRLTVELQSSLYKDDLRFYGVRISYK
jgi:hypothetical protein